MTWLVVGCDITTATGSIKCCNSTTFSLGQNCQYALDLPNLLAILFSDAWLLWSNYAPNMIRGTVHILWCRIISLYYACPKFLFTSVSTMGFEGYLPVLLFCHNVQCNNYLTLLIFSKRIENVSCLKFNEIRFIRHKQWCLIMDVWSRVGLQSTVSVVFG